MRALAIAVLTALSASILSARADAVCSTSTTLKAWGDFWVERNASGECLIKAQRYPCGATAGFRVPDAPTVVATVTPGDTSRNCEDLAGYDAAIATMMAKYTLGAGSNECNKQVDADQDGFNTCIETVDDNPRVWVNSNANETVCDGVDNDADGTIDDGFASACEKDHKRLWQSNLVQGDRAATANLIEGNLLRSETDISTQGPYGLLSFTRVYNSRRETDDAGIGKGWTHSYSVQLKQMPTGDDRWQVLTPSGTNQYFRCTAYGATMQCAIDDHRIAGNLKRTGSRFYYYPGDGTVYRFSDTVVSGKRAYDEHRDGSGFLISSATIDGSGRVLQVTSANSSIYLAFSYSTYGLNEIRLSSTSVNLAVDYDVVSGPYLDKVKWASTLGTIDTDTFVQYFYTASTNNLITVKSKLDASTTLVLGDYTFDGSDRVATMKDASKDLSVSYPSATTTSVVYNVNPSGNPTSTFTHNGLWVASRNAVDRMGGMSAASQVYDEHGRITCFETDDSRMSKLVFSDSTVPIRIDVYGKAGTCASGGTIDHKSWMSYDYNSNSQSRRPAWVRRTSVYSGSADCSAAVLTTERCFETQYAYASTTDDRLRTVTTTGYTWDKVDDAGSTKRTLKRGLYYFGLDPTICTSADSYAGLPCRSEAQDSGGAAFSRHETTYYASGATAGLPKTSKSFDSSSDASPQTTTYGSYNLFGSPLTVTVPAGYTTTNAYNGYDAPTSITETNSLLNDTTPTPGYLSPITSFSYNKLRRIDTVTLPKGNKRITKYFTGATDYARTKASATADASSNLLEIQRYDYNKFGSRTESKILDSIVGTTPCADENCTTYEVRHQTGYNALRQVVNTYLHATDTADPPDATASYTYTSGQPTSASSYLGVTSATTYDDQGRVLTRTGDSGGLGAATTFAYDAAGQLYTTISPTGIVTRTERDDFGQLVLERSPTTGDTRFEYNAGGFQTKRRRSSFESSANAEDTCYTGDWLGRQLSLDHGCNGVDWNYLYDGDSIPASACRANTVQTGHLSTFYKTGAFKRVNCYHPNGRLYSSYQMNTDDGWSNSGAKGTTTIFDLNGNLSKEYIFDRPDGHTYAREVEYVFDSTLKDRVSYVRERLTSAGSWTLITSDTTLPTYFPFGVFKTIRYANSVDETNTRDKAYRLTRRRSENGATKYTDINLTYDVGSRITTYDDSTGYRHLKYYTKFDPLSRLRCVSRSAISSCSGVEPWENQFLESFDYDLAGNRTNRRYGAYDTSDDDAYAYVNDVKPTEIIDSVTSGGTVKQMSNDPKGNITQVNQPNQIDYTWNPDSQLSTTNDNFLGTVTHNYSALGDRYSKVGTCNSRKVFYHYAGGSSSRLQMLSLWNSCAAEYPRTLRSYIYLEGRPISVVHSTVASAASDTQTEVNTYWVHTDQAGSPVLVTNNVRTELWRWENDPFGRSDAIEYTVFAQDVNPDDTSGNPYKTCCCTGCGAGCGLCTTGCSAGQCTGGASQAQVWSKTYTPGSANNVRLHFSAFNVAAGTSRTAKDYFQYVASNGTTVLANFTGNLGDFWGPWSGGASVTGKFISDYVADGTAGWTVDKLEYTTTANGRYVMHLRDSYKITDDDAKAYAMGGGWYRKEDGRVLDPNGLGGTSRDENGVLVGNGSPMPPMRYVPPPIDSSYDDGIDPPSPPIITRGGAGLLAQDCDQLPLSGAHYGCWASDHPQAGPLDDYEISIAGPNPDLKQCKERFGNASSDVRLGCVDGFAVCLVCQCPYYHANRRRPNAECCVQEDDGSFRVIECPEDAVEFARQQAHDGVPYCDDMPCQPTAFVVVLKEHCGWFGIGCSYSLSSLTPKYPASCPMDGIPSG